MTGKEILFSALKCKKTPRIPWVPFVGCHGGKLIGVDAKTYLNSSEYIVKGIKKAIELYKPDGIPVIFDLQIEAEALGCKLQWGNENPPAVASHILREKKLEELKIPSSSEGRFPVVLEAMKILSSEIHDVAFYGLVTGPFTLALHLLGTEIFIQMYDNPSFVKEILEFCKEVAINTSSMYMDAGCEVIAIVDPMTSQISPDNFKEFVSPYATEIFRHIREHRRYSSFFVCGPAQNNIEVMCQTKPDNISIDENIPLDYVKNICKKYNISFGGNIRLTVVMLFGTVEDNKRNAIECMQIGGNEGFILSPGCDMPYATPEENVIGIAEIVHDEYQRQVAIELLSKKEEVKVDIDLSDYGSIDKVIIDIITLDSEACAPCQYMVKSVEDIAPEFGDLVIWREHKIKNKEAVEFMSALMVKNVPAICIDGKIEFVGKIPPRDELIAAIQRRINEKLNLKLRQKKNKIIVFGGECEACKATYENVKKAIRELGSDIELQYITDEKLIAEYGVAQTPAVMIIKEQLKIAGKVPSVEVVREWLKEL